MSDGQERKEWKHDTVMLERHVDAMVNTLKHDAQALPIAYMAVDMVFRPFLQWVHSAQTMAISPMATRNSAIHLINMMVLELASRMNRREHGIDSALEWTDEFMEILTGELEDDLRTLMGTQNGKNHGRRDEEDEHT